MGNCIQSDPLDNHLTFGDKEWTDYRYSFEVKNDDDDSVGTVFRYTSSGSFYLMYLSADQAPHEAIGCNWTFVGARLLRVREGDSKLLAKVEGTTYTPGQPFRVQVEAVGGHLRVWLDLGYDGAFSEDEILFDLVDGEPLPTGQVGLWAYENGATNSTMDPCSKGGCWFDTLVIDLDP